VSLIYDLRIWAQEFDGNIHVVLDNLGIVDDAGILETLKCWKNLSRFCNQIVAMSETNTACLFQPMTEHKSIEAMNGIPMLIRKIRQSRDEMESQIRENADVCEAAIGNRFN
jgi:hypothetical protein